ncbi:hypothetical protein DNTS_029632 [Danionella cerebrum]|uniref:Impact N-terminal domain-containing protein n=1 Tax=Danionella cerebrum TaxID=2873325 RepID=A0A553QPK5_9TELE|nr:hypothetical protein DNTS_029632 [Danionella translucida]
MFTNAGILHQDQFLTLQRGSLQILDVSNVLVVVSRWYGGILLGPDRFKHINNCARNILLQEGYTHAPVRPASDWPIPDLPVCLCATIRRLHLIEVLRRVSVCEGLLSLRLNISFLLRVRENISVALIRSQTLVLLSTSPPDSFVCCFLSFLCK